MSWMTDNLHQYEKKNGKKKERENFITKRTSIVIREDRKIIIKLKVYWMIITLHTLKWNGNLRVCPDECLALFICLKKKEGLQV